MRLTGGGGAVGQGLVPAASGLLGGLIGSYFGAGSTTQALLGGVAPALAGGTPEAAQQILNNLTGGLFVPTPPGLASPPSPASIPGQAVFNIDGTVDAGNLNGYPPGSG